MYKYLKKLVFLFSVGGALVFTSSGLIEYLSIGWNISISNEPVYSLFKKFKHIKYPLIFSKPKNKNKLSAEGLRLKQKIASLDKRIIKVFANASSLFYLDYLPLDVIEKEFRPKDITELLLLSEAKRVPFSRIKDRNSPLSLFSNFNIEPIVINNLSVSKINWSKYYDEIGIESEILAHQDFFNSKNQKSKFVENEKDLIKIVQSATEKSSEKITLAKTDELVFFSYQEKKKDDELSNVVLKAIERELKRNTVTKLAAAKARGSKVYSKSSIVAPPVGPEKRVKYKAQRDLLETEVVTIGVKVDDKLMDLVSGIEFIPHYDKNERVFDESEGVLHLTSNLKKSNYIHGTFLGKDFINMRTSIPLYMGGGVFEVPLLEKEAMNKLLDKEGLRGSGAFLLVDLGESAIDVDIDRPFEARTFFNEDFKVTTQEGAYKYIFYVGVEPGNLVLRYLNSNGRTFEKLTFLADSEMTFEFFSKSKTINFRFETFELSPLSREPKPLSIQSEKINLFAREDTPKQVGLNSFVFENYVGIRDSNSYLEFNHLGNSVFAGMRYSNYVILPSAKFIDSIIEAENLESLDGHCLIQLNFSGAVKNILYEGEDNLGPMQVLLHYLDEDGVLSEEPSLLSKHAFLLGVGQGVINIQIEFLNGDKLISQSFCSEGTYLVEQL